MIRALLGVIMQGGSSGGIDAYTKSMLHFNGADASTTFTDEIGKTWTAYGSAQLDTAQKKFGTASGLFGGTGNYIDTPDHADFAFGSGDFTIDFQMMRNANGGQYAFGQCDSSVSGSSTSIYLYITGSNYPSVAVYSGANPYQATSSVAVTADSAWHHIAIVRSGNALMIFIDGVQCGAADVTGVTINNSANKFAIGRPGEYNNVYFNGWIDEFRVSKGISRWTADFTPPTSEYSA